MAQNETWTVGRLLGWTAEYLGRHGSDSPRLDAEVLLAHALGCPRIGLYTSFETEPEEARRAAFRELVRRRAEGEPVAYLVGHKEFYSLEFRVTPDVLIPRPETEHVIVTLLDLLRDRAGEGLALCDVGTGSGIIAVVAAKHLPQAHVTAVDTSVAALLVAGENARRHGVAERITFFQSDLLGAILPEQTFDLVASNPPYVSRTELAALAPEVREHEPETALLAGDRGTEVIERLLPQAAERLAPGGHLVVEISPMIHTAVLELFASQPQFAEPQTVKDLARLPRVVWARRK